MSNEVSVGISSSVAIFLLLTSVCCIFSLSSTDDDRDAEQSKVFKIPKSVSNFAMSAVMSIGIVAMLILIVRREDLTTRGQEGQLTRRHYLHRKYSLRSILLFFVVGSILHFNYLIVEFCCVDSWIHCDQFANNLSELVFHFGCILFASCETAVCWIMKPNNFKRSQGVWHAVTVIQAANFATWFDSLLKESYHRINDNAEMFDSYFSFCNATSRSRNQSETAWCSESSIAAKWFIWSIPFLFPITIELSVLVSETLLNKVISGNNNDDVAEPAVAPDRPVPSTSANPNERTPLLQHGNENPNRATLPRNYTNSCWSKIFILIAVIINIVYILLTILVFVGYKLNGVPAGIPVQLQTFANVFHHFLDSL